MAESGTPLGRARWFVERAGARRGATAPRLEAARAVARNIPTIEALPQRLVVEAMDALRERLRQARLDRRESPFAVAVDARGETLEVDTINGTLDARAFGPIVQVKELEARWAFLGIAFGDVDRYRASALRLVWARERADAVAIVASAYSIADGVLVAVVTSAGAYQAAFGEPVVSGDWEELGPTLDPTSDRGIGRVTQIDVHPSNGDILVAAAAGGGVWRTDDGGAHWRPLMDDEPSLTIGAVAIAPSDPDVIYAASGEDARPYDPAWPGHQIYQSDDGGNSWSICASVKSTRFSEIAVHPHTPQIAYVAGNVGLHRTPDGGQYWATLLEGRITSVVIDHDEPNHVYVGVYRRGVYRTTNGYTFSRVVLDPALEGPHLADHGYVKLAIGRHGASRGRFLIAKLGKDGELIYVSRNGGRTWTKGPVGVATSTGFAEWTSVIAVSPEDESVLYAGQRFTLKRSLDGGATWKTIGAELHPDHQDLVFDPGQPDRIFLANDAGVYRSTDRGDTWSFASGDLDIAQLHDIDISEADPEIVVCGAQESGIHYRSAGGQWRSIPFPKTQYDGTRVVIDASDPAIVYACGQHGITNLATGGLARTLNASATAVLGTRGLTGRSPFVTILSLDPDPNVASPATNRVMFLAGNSGLIPHLFRSVDGGANWARVEYSDGAPFVPEGDVTVIEFDRGNPSVIVLGTTLGALYRTTTGGANATDWARVSAPAIAGGQISSIALDPSDPRHLWVAFFGDGVTATDRPDDVFTGISHVFKTTDLGATWTDASGWPAWPLPDVPTSAVLLDDQTRFPGRAFVGTDVGVFVTWDGGCVWTKLGQGPPKAPITQLRLHRGGRWLFAATMGRGVYRYKLA